MVDTRSHFTLSPTLPTWLGLGVILGIEGGLD